MIAWLRDLLLRLLVKIFPELATVIKVANFFRGLSGAPKMTPEQEKDWMDRATPHNDPSQENSNVGSG